MNRPELLGVARHLLAQLDAHDVAARGSPALAAS